MEWGILCFLRWRRLQAVAAAAKLHFRGCRLQLPSQEHGSRAAAERYAMQEQAEAAYSSARESGCCEALVLRRGAAAEEAMLQITAAEAGV